MTKVVIDLEDLKAQRLKLEEEIKRIDWMIATYFPEEKKAVKDTQLQLFTPENSFKSSRMGRALDICETYLKEGNKVYSINQFLTLIKTKGVELSRPGMAMALRRPESNIEFDNTSRMWILKNSLKD